MINHTYQYIHLHIPRTGGATIHEMITPGTKEFNAFIKPTHAEYSYYMKKYYVFTFVRNTWDRLVSIYHFCLENPAKDNWTSLITQHHDTFESFIMDFLDEDTIENCEWVQSQMDWIRDPLTMQPYPVDYVGRIENLRQDILPILNKFDMRVKPPIPHINQTVHRLFYDYYEVDMYDKVASLYEEEIQYFDFTIEEGN